MSRQIPDEKEQEDAWIDRFVNVSSIVASIVAVISLIVLIIIFAFSLSQSPPTP